MARPFLLRTRWLVGHLIIIAVSALFFLLMQWQLDRLDQRKERNLEIHAAMNTVPITHVPATETKNWQHLQLTGTWDGSNTRLLRYPLHAGQSGYEVVTPIVLGNGNRIPVLRGWIPLETGKALTFDGIAPTGMVTIDAWYRRASSGEAGEKFSPASQTTIPTIAKLTQPYAQILPGKPSGDIMQGQTKLTPVTRDGPDTSEGPHRSYALQWVSFVAIAVGGWGALLWRVWRDEQA